MGEEGKEGKYGGWGVEALPHHRGGGDKWKGQEVTKANNTARNSTEEMVVGNLPSLLTIWLLIMCS